MLRLGEINDLPLLFFRERERKGGVLGVCCSALVWVWVRRAMAFPDASSDLLLPMLDSPCFLPHGKQRKKGQRQSPLSQTSQLQIFLSLFLLFPSPILLWVSEGGGEQQFLPLPQREGLRGADGRGGGGGGGELIFLRPPLLSLLRSMQERREKKGGEEREAEAWFIALSIACQWGRGEEEEEGVLRGDGGKHPLQEDSNVLKFNC